MTLQNTTRKTKLKFDVNASPSSLLQAPLQHHCPVKWYTGEIMQLESNVATTQADCIAHKAIAIEVHINE